MLVRQADLGGLPVRQRSTGEQPDLDGMATRQLAVYAGHVDGGRRAPVCWRH